MSEEVIIQKSILDNIGNAIRTKEGSSSLIPVTALSSRITALEGGGKEPVFEDVSSSVTVNTSSSYPRIIITTSQNIETLCGVVCFVENLSAMFNACIIYDPGVKKSRFITYMGSSYPAISWTNGTVSVSNKTVSLNAQSANALFNYSNLTINNAGICYIPA